MKKYLISLDKDTHRRELFFAQENTQDFEVFSAINTMQQDWEELALQFNLAKFEQHYQRKVTKGEVGCTLSHLAVFQKILNNPEIQNEEYCLICEDDALFNAHWQQHIEMLISQNPHCDIILVGQSKIADFNDIELEINYPTTFSCLMQNIKQSQFKFAYPYKSYFAGTVAYLIKKSAIEKFINQLSHSKTPFWLADDFILFGQQFDVQNMVVRPLLAIENPKLVSNLESIRGSVANNLVKKLMKYPLKKLLAIKRNLFT